MRETIEQLARNALHKTREEEGQERLKERGKEYDGATNKGSATPFMKRETCENKPAALQAVRQTDRQDRQTDRQTHTQTDRQRETHRQTDRQKDTARHP